MAVFALLLPLLQTKYQSHAARLGGRKGLFDIELIASNYSVASDHFLPRQEYELRISKASILWKLFFRQNQEQHSVSKI